MYPARYKPLWTLNPPGPITPIDLDIYHLEIYHMDIYPPGHIPPKPIPL